MGWCQDHMIPAPYLVMTGMSYLMPAILAWYHNCYYTVISCLFLCGTTMSFHWFRYQWLFQLDVVAIINYNICGLYNVYLSGPSGAAVWGLSVSYSLYAYFVGQKLKILSWDPDWNTQMFFHGLIHMSTAYAGWYMITKRSLIQ